MDMRLVLDFETVDPHLDKLGSGWVHGDMLVVGASIRMESWKGAIFLTNKQEIISYVNQADVIICHNANYDVGILLMWNVDISNKYIVDTMCMAKLFNSSLRSYSLDELAKKYLKAQKTKDELGQIVIDKGLYKDSKGKQINTKDVRKGHKYAITHMDEMYKVSPEIVIQYANQDANLTWDLYRYFINRVSKQWMDKVSIIYKILLKNRQRGVRIDIDRVREVRDILHTKELAALNKLKEMSKNCDFNPLSGPHVSELLYKFGIPYPFTAKGNPSIQQKWLETQPHDVCAQIREYRKYNKVRRDFCDSVLHAQELLPICKKGRVYPEYKIFGASTGRFSCSKPNIMQIPGRDEEIAPLIRSMYVADEGEQWYSLDFSQQEFRLFAHFVELYFKTCGIAESFRKDPRIDFHDFVADLCSIERPHAKTINFGSMYGMGVDKMAIELKLSIERASELLRKYHTSFTDVRKLSNICSKTLKNEDYITTIGGRKLFLGPPAYVDELIGYEYREIKGRRHKVPIYQKKLVTFEYKGLNMLIQGSAADQMINLMIMVDKLGIPMLFSVYDELNLSLETREYAEKVKEIMETGLKLRVPMVTDIGEGNSWADAK